MVHARRAPRRRPHRLDLYELAVQHPPAEVAFLLRCYEHHRGCLPTRLKEDFAGTAAVAAHWVSLHGDMRALAVDAHGPTLRRAARRCAARLGPRTVDLHCVQADVAAVTRPRVDMVAALNFSTFVYHERSALLTYFRAARRALWPDGLLVIDAYGGPGAMRTGEQRRTIRPAAGHGIEPFVYHWEQRDHDPISGRVDCRIHFTLAGGEGMANAFRYRWRLWSLPELCELMRAAGFAEAEVWCDGCEDGRSDGHYRPRRRLDPREDWVAYVVGVR